MSNTLRTNCMIVGEAGVGKTSLVSAAFNKNYEMTFGVNLSVKVIRIPDTKYRVELYIHDCGGKPVYEDIVKELLTEAALVIIAFDVSSESSFKAAKEWSEKWSKTTREHPTFGVLIACKTDLTSRRTITPGQGEELSQQLGLQYFESSAKEAGNVDAAFFYLAHEWYKLYMEKSESFTTAHL